MIPETTDCGSPVGDLDKRNRLNAVFGPPMAPPPPAYPLHDPAGLIMPRKPQNPCLESRGHKDLHRELLFNQKIGKNVLGQKSELQRALEKHKEQQVKKETEQMKEETPLERMIHERARRLEMKDKPDEVEQKVGNNGAPEFLQVHAKLRARMDTK